MRFQPKKITVDTDDFNREVFTFSVVRDVEVLLVRYEVQRRQTKRHKWCVKGGWGIHVYDRFPIPAEPPPLPQWMIDEALEAMRSQMFFWEPKI